MMDCKECGKTGCGPLCIDCNDKRLEEKIRQVVADSIPSGPPSGIITVKNGKLSKECIERIKEFMDEVHINPHMEKILILEAESLAGKDATIQFNQVNWSKPPPIIQLREDRTTATVISGNIEEVREILRRNGSILPGLEIDDE